MIYKLLTRSAWLLAGLWFMALANGADINTTNRCDTRGLNCVSDCRTYDPVSRDDACWAITSPQSDWEKPWLALNVKDYRP